MSIQIYFINETKKQVVSTKKLYGNFEDNQQLLCYLSLCAGDTFRTELEGGQWIEKFLYEEKHKDFKPGTKSNSAENSDQDSLDNGRSINETN